MKGSAVFLVFIVLFLSARGSLAVEGQGPGYGGDVKKGWYWYEVEKEEEASEEPEEKAVEAASPVDPWKMSAGDFRKLLEETRDRAVAEPTVENVTRYIVLQDVARRKSAAFAAVYQMVMQTRPEFSTASEYPWTNPGIRALVSMRSREVHSTIEEAAGDFAMVYFHRPDCRFCQAEEKVLAYFIERYASWEIKKVDVYKEPTAAARFGASIVPYILVVYRETGEYMPVSAGVVSLTDLELRLYRSIRYLKGETTPSRFLLYGFQDQGPADPEMRVHEVLFGPSAK